MKNVKYKVAGGSEMFNQINCLNDCLWICDPEVDWVPDDYFPIS